MTFGSTHHAASPSQPSCSLCHCRPVRSAPLHSTAHDAVGHGGSLLGAGRPLTLSPTVVRSALPASSNPPAASSPPPSTEARLPPRSEGTWFSRRRRRRRPPPSSGLAWSGDPSGRDSFCLVE